MPLPTRFKTWQFQINQIMAAQGTTTLSFHELFRVIKNLLKAFPLRPWSVSGSSDARIGPLGSAGMDGIDRWTTAAVIEGAASGSRHAWIVLRQTGIATAYEICIDFNVNSVTSASFIVSPVAGFTGGSVTDRPTAVDEIVIVNAAGFWSGVDVRHVIHAWQSSDGQCTRISVHRAGTNQCTFMLMDVPQGPITGWTTPSVTTFKASGSGFTANYTDMVSTSNSGTRGRANSVSMTLFWTGEGNSGVIFPNFTDIGTVANEISTLHTLFGIGVASITTTTKGRHGFLSDILWRPVAANEMDTFGNGDFACFGNVVLPWTRDNTIPLNT